MFAVSFRVAEATERDCFGAAERAGDDMVLMASRMAAFKAAFDLIVWRGSNINTVSIYNRRSIYHRDLLLPSLSTLVYLLCLDPLETRIPSSDLVAWVEGFTRKYSLGSPSPTRDSAKAKLYRKPSFTEV